LLQDIKTPENSNVIYLVLTWQIKQLTWKEFYHQFRSIYLQIRKNVMKLRPISLEFICFLPRIFQGSQSINENIMKRSIYVSLLLSLLTICGTWAQTVDIKVYPEILRQEIISMGGNYCQANYTNHAWDAIGEATLDEFRPSHVRLALPLQFRGQEYHTYKGEKINEQAVIITLFETMRRMKEEYGVSNFTISVWRIADELVENPGQNNKRRIKADKYGEVIDMITAFLLKVKRDYGVETDYFSFNESDGGYDTLLSPEETIRFFHMASNRFREAGLKTKFLWGDTHQTRGTVEFATMVKADSTLWKYIGPLCFHSWWSENIPDSEFERIADLARAWGKEVWCNELGFDAMSWRVPGMNASWDFGLRFAKIAHRMLKYARVQVSQYWTWQNNYAIMSADTKTKYPSYYVTRHQVQFLNSGTQIVHSASSDPDVMVLAGIHPQKGRILHVLNLKEQATEIEIDGMSGGDFRMVSTTESNLWDDRTIKGKVRKGKMKLTLEPGSVNSLIF
jgi:hypothetical protein